VAEPKSKILIVEDDLDVADMLNAYFRVQGYDVFVVNWGLDGVRAAQTARPDLIILDIRLPDIDGFEVARRLRTDRKTQDVPMIFLTEKRERIDRLQGLELGADDYITKPFDVQELRLRVRNALSRARLDTLTNPVTGLPEGTLVDEKLAECLSLPDRALMVVSLENLDDFRDAYGFVASDDTVRAISLMIHNVVREMEIADAFVGHLNLADFLLIVPAASLGGLTERIKTRLDQSLEYFYPIRDRDKIGSNPKRLAVKTVAMPTGAGAPDDLAALKAELLARKA
jgi:PleD family two-component response regulator